MSRNLRVWSTARKWGQPGSRGVQVSGAGPAPLVSLTELADRCVLNRFTTQRSRHGGKTLCLPCASPLLRGRAKHVDSHPLRFSRVESLHASKTVSRSEFGA